MNNLSLKITTVFLVSIMAALFFMSSHSIGAMAFVAFIPIIIFYLGRQTMTSVIKLMLVILFFIPFHYFRFLNIFNVINPLTVFGFVLCLNLGHQILVQRDRQAVNFLIIDKLYFVFIFSAMISTLSAKSVLGSLNWIFYSFTTGYVVYRVLMGLQRENIYQIIRFMVITASLCATEGIAEYCLHKSVVFGEFPGRLTSLLGHPLVNGLIFSVIFPFSLALYLKTREKKFIVTSLILFSSIILTFSRGSWLALAFGMCIVISFVTTCHRKKILLGAFILAIVVFLVPFIRGPILERLNANEDKSSSSFNVRLKSIPIAFEIIKDKPFFGGGPYNSVRYKNDYTYNELLRKTSFENTYLGLTVDLGLIGISLLILIYTISLGKIFHALGRASSYDKIYQVAAFSSYSILLINMTTFNFDSYRSFSFVTWFLTGIGLALTKK